jgi:hypothetical protein
VVSEGKVETGDTFKWITDPERYGATGIKAGEIGEVTARDFRGVCLFVTRQVERRIPDWILADPKQFQRVNVIEVCDLPAVKP